MPSALRALPARRIVAHLAAAAQRWSDADFPPRVRASAAIERRLGYRAPVVDYALDRLFFGLREPALEAAIVAELGSLDALDGTVVRNGVPDAWARGVERVVIVASDTTIGVALLPAVFALCAKCDVLVKDRDDALASAFFATLAEEDAAFGDAARARVWRGGDDPAEAAAFAEADVVVAFGGDDAVRAIRARCGASTRFVPFAHRASIGRLAAADVAGFADPLAERIARDTLLYDGDGCLSLHALFVAARDTVLLGVAERLSSAFARVAVEFPPGPVGPERAAAVAAHRGVAAFRAAGGRGAVLRGGGATLIVDAPRDEPPPFLPRVLPLIAVDGDDDIAAYVAAQRIPIQALGVVRPDDAASALAAALGAVRVAPLGTLQDPPLGGHHGGAARIADFVRWVDRA